MMKKRNIPHMEICILQISMWGVLHSAADGMKYTGEVMLLTSFVFAITMGNTGMAVLLLVYWTQRRKRTVGSELKKMQLNELR